MRRRLFLWIILMSLIGPPLLQAAPCQGKFINPITDVCWSCLFPISIGGMTVHSGGQKDTPNPTLPVCLCPKPPLPLVPGIPVGFWEPVRLLDITRTKFCFVNLGGLQLGASSLTGHGATHKKANVVSHAFYQAHYYTYPLLYWLELFTDFLMLEEGSFDLAYMSELDVTWNNDTWSTILAPEPLLFANPIAQAACAADCVKTATTGFPFDKLFWCGACQGSLYPFTGHVSHHVGGVESSLLLVQRTLAKLHRMGLALETSGERSLCKKQLRSVIKKSQYKTQMTYPLAATSPATACNPLGKSSVVWGAGKEFPNRGEDFGYLIWRKRNGCVL